MHSTRRPFPQKKMGWVSYTVDIQLSSIYPVLHFEIMEGHPLNPLHQPVREVMPLLEAGPSLSSRHLAPNMRLQHGDVDWKLENSAGMAWKVQKFWFAAILGNSQISRTSKWIFDRSLMAKLLRWLAEPHLFEAQESYLPARSVHEILEWGVPNSKGNAGLLWI